MASTVRGDARCIQCMVHSIHECPFTFLYLKAIKANIGFSGQLISFTGALQANRHLRACHHLRICMDPHHAHTQTRRLVTPGDSKGAAQAQQRTGVLRQGSCLRSDTQRHAVAQTRSYLPARARVFIKHLIRKEAHSWPTCKDMQRHSECATTALLSQARAAADSQSAQKLLARHTSLSIPTQRNAPAPACYSRARYGRL